MKKIMMALPLAAMMIGGCATTEATDSLKVASYNIRLECGKPGSNDCWMERRADLAKTIREINPDVFGLQEVCPPQMAYLKEQFPEYEFVGDHRNKDRISGEASPVVYRRSRFEAEKAGTFWLSEHPDVPASKSWKTACTRVCSYLVLRDLKTGKRFCFANTHTDHKSALAREKGMLLIIERMKSFGEGLPIVFTGDHNCRQYDKPAKEVAKILDNALNLSETAPKGSWRTFNGWVWQEKELSAVEAMKLPEEKRDGAKASRIDYIYVTPGTRVLDYETVNRVRDSREKIYPSDHFPVTATIVIR